MRIIVEQMRSLFRCCVALVVLQGAVMAQSSSPAEDTPPADSPPAERKMMRSHTTWERILYFPGQVIYAPLKYSLKGLSVSIGYIVPV